MRSVAVINQKGGCGKTTTAISLAGVFSRLGCRTLLVDLDPQSHCAAGLAIPEDRIELDIGDALISPDGRRPDLRRLLWRISRDLDLAPSRTRLAGVESARGQLAELPDREHRLRKFLDSVAHAYDACVIDCSPSIGLLAFNAIVAADAVLIPVETGFYALQGAGKQVTSIKSLGKRLGVTIPHWIVPTLHEEDSAHARDLLDELRRRYGPSVAPACIRRDQALKEAASFGLPVSDYAPRSTGTSDYTSLARWIGDLLGLPLPPSEDPKPLAIDDPTSPVPEAHRVVGREDESRREHLASAAPRTDRSLEAEAGSDTASESGPDPAWIATLTSRESPLRRRSLLPGTPVVIDRAEVERAPRAASSTLRHLYGARQVGERVLFVQPLCLGSTVAVAGEFNTWSTTSHTLKRNNELGVHELTLRMPPGRHAYRLYVDGRWIPDPYNENRRPNPFGDFDSILSVKSAVHLAESAD